MNSPRVHVPLNFHNQADRSPIDTEISASGGPWSKNGEKRIKTRLAVCWFFQDLTPIILWNLGFLSGKLCINQLKTSKIMGTKNWRGMNQEQSALLWASQLNAKGGHAIRSGGTHRKLCGGGTFKVVGFWTLNQNGIQNDTKMIQTYDPIGHAAPWSVAKINPGKPCEGRERSAQWRAPKRCMTWTVQRPLVVAPEVLPCCVGYVGL